MSARFMLLVALVTALLVQSCGNDFDPVSKVESVRILGSRADKPYAKPGDTVTVELLAFDGRAEKPRPMVLSWLPFPCISPPDDAYYNCYPSFATEFALNADASAGLVVGTKTTFAIPANVLEKTPSSQGGVPYANVFFFNMACAGRVKYVGPRTTSPQAVPFACIDEAGTELGPDDFVFAYARIFVFADRTNDNPVIDGLTFAGQAVDLGAGITINHCTNVNDNKAKCPETKMDVIVPPTSQEVDPTNIDVAGTVGSEGIWADWYVTGGRMKSEVRILYDGRTGRISDSANDVSGPASPSEQVVWAVVHDNRGGVSWISAPMHGR